MMHSVQRLLVILFVAFFAFFLGGLQCGTALAAPTTPTADFTDNNDGTVTHSTTGLTWKRCSEGQTWTSSTCTGTATGYTWAAATGLTSTFAGYSDWRLPTVRELSTIAEMDAYNPAINSSIFPNTPASNFWSASAYAGDSSNAWRVTFGHGGDASESNAGNYQVRLVRGGQSLGLLDVSRPTTDYVDNGDGTVTHTPTALTWKRCTEGQTWSGGTCTGTVTAATSITWAAAMALTSTFAGKSDWRLPTILELRSLMDFTLFNPTINRTIFPNAQTDGPSSHYWSASVYAGDSSSAWFASTYVGNDDPSFKTSNKQVRLVRGGPSSVTLSGLSLSCPSTINASASGSCSATASYSDASSKSVSASWSSSNTSALAVNSGGNLTAGTPSSDTPVTISASYTENGVTKTATQSVTVKAAITLTSLSATCPSTINANASGSCSATASYSDASSKSVSASWSSSNTTALSVNSGGSLTAGAPSSETPVTISASYTENGVTKTASQSVTVKAAAPTLTSLSATCSSTINAGAGGTCSATASYSNGTSKAVSPTWSSSNTTALSVNSGGSLTAGTPSSDTSVTISASYTESGVTKTATQSVTVKAATPALPTLSSLSIAGSTTVNAGSTTQFSTTASYSDNSSKLVVPSWSVSGNGANIDSNGVLTTSMIYADVTVTVTASYTENGVTKTASKSITIKAAPPTLTGLSLSCPATVNAGSSASCGAMAAYSNNTSNAVSVTWVSSNSSVLGINSGSLTAGQVTTDTPVSIDASYTENGVTKTASTTVTVKASTTATLTSLELTCPAGITANSTGNCFATAIFSDGKKTPITSAAWTVTPSDAAAIDAAGMVTAGKVTADTLITVSVSYTENSKTVSAAKTITIKMAACLANTSGITIDGAPAKKFGDSLNVRYRLCNFNKATFFDLYIAVQLPDKTLMFMQSAGTFFSVPVFSLQVQPYLANTLLPDWSGSVLSMDVLPMSLPTGTYTFYAVPVLAGGNVMNGFEWVGELAKEDVTLGR